MNNLCLCLNTRKKKMQRNLGMKIKTTMTISNERNKHPLQNSKTEHLYDKIWLSQRINKINMIISG